MSKRLTEEEVFKRFADAHGDTYDYSRVVYVGKSYKIIIGCPIHSWFEQRAGDHMSGQGCRKCGLITSANKQRKTTEQFIKDAIEVHGDLYDYSLVNYLGHAGEGKEVDIICSIHGKFSQKPAEHLDGNGCQKCGNIAAADSKRLPQEEAIENFKKIHGDTYNYDKVIFKGTGTNVVITCKIHGNFNKIPYNHLAGQGCPACTENGFKKSLPAILYYIKDTETGFYKTGITNRTTKERYGTRMKRIDIIHEEEFNLGKDAYDKEQSILEEFSEYRVTNEDFGDGKTEFFSKDILNLDTLA